MVDRAREADRIRGSSVPFDGGKLSNDPGKSMGRKQVLRETYRVWLRLVRKRQHRGNDAYCPCCRSWERSFRDYVMPDRACRVCGSLERHRLVSLLYDLRPELLLPGADVLNIAPDPMLAARVSRSAGRYVAGDLEGEFGPTRLDVLDLQFPDASFDVVICNHVLEHIPDDRQAMREIRRVLRPNGWSMLLVPDVRDPTTDEDLTITDPGERLRRYGQRDHVRRYGWDYLERLRECGLEPDVIRMENVLTLETIRLCRLAKSGEVEPLFLAQRGSDA
jgi:SAM-dependent methyltransferase